MPAAITPSLKSIAQATGVSLSTVSRALQGNPRLKPETIAAVRAAAQAAGYRVNPFISDTMRRVRTRGRLGHFGAIAYLTFHDSVNGWQRNPTYLRFHEGAVRRAHDLGFSLDTIWACEPRLQPRRLTAILKARGIAGVVVGPRPVQPVADVIDWTKFPSASVGVPLPRVHLHQAGSHHARLMEQMLVALGERGYRRPGLVLLETQISKTDPGWVTTWVYRQQEMPAAQRVPLLVMSALQPKRIEQWVQRHRPDVVIGVEEEIGRMLAARGWRVPEEIGFAHLSRPERADAPAGMDQRPRAIGAAAVDLVANQIFSGERGLAEIPRVLLIEGEWIEGWSVRKA